MNTALVRDLALMVPIGLAVSGLLFVYGCAEGVPTARTQRVVDVACAKDRQFQPIIVPVVLVAAPLAGPYAPAVVADQLLIHPGVVAACREYESKPAAIVPSMPNGAIVTREVKVEVKP